MVQGAKLSFYPNFTALLNELIHQLSLPGSTGGNGELIQVVELVTWMFLFSFYKVMQKCINSLRKKQTIEKLHEAIRRSTCTKTYITACTYIHLSPRSINPSNHSKLSIDCWLCTNSLTAESVSVIKHSVKIISSLLHLLNLISLNLNPILYILSCIWLLFLQLLLNETLALF